MYDSTYSASDDAALAALGGMFMTVMVLALVSYVLTSLGLMKFFERAGKPTWAAWVPVYNVWVMAEVAMVEDYWKWIYVGGILVSFIPLIGQLLSFAAVVAMIYITYRFLQRFGKDVGSTVLAVLFPFAYYPIVGFSKELKYSKAKEAKA